MSLQKFSWASIPEMHSCGMQSVTWVAQGISNTAPLTISITDRGVPQLADPDSSSSTTDTTTTSSTVPASTITGNTQVSVPTQTVAGASRRSAHRRQDFDNWNGYGGSWLPYIDTDLVENLDPTSQNWTWSSVNVTQGWYVLTATVASFAISEPSEPFFVANGTSTFPCLAATAPSSTSSTLAPSSVSSSSASSTPTSANDTGSSGSSSSSHSNAGAIAGGVVGGVAFIAAVIAVLFFFLCRRKRNLRARSAVGPGIPPKKTKRRGERSESMQALPTKAGHGSHSSSLASVAAAGPVSEEGLSMRENYVAGVLPYTPAPPVSRRFSTQSAMNYKPSAPYEGYNMAPLRSTSQPGATRDGAVPSALTIPPSDEALGGSPPSAARRKPVPKYDAEEFGDADANTSTESASASTDAAHYKRHSFVNMKPMQHVIQPDLPANRQA